MNQDGNETVTVAQMAAGIGASLLTVVRWLLIVQAVLQIGLSLLFLLMGEPLLLYLFGPLGLLSLGLSWLAMRGAAWCARRSGPPKPRMFTPSA